MNDLPYILYRPSLMLVDTMDMDLHTEVAHRRLCDFIWAHERAPLKENSVLRQITRIEATDWGRVRRGLEHKGWHELGQYLVHRGAIESLNESSRRAAENANRTATAGGRPVLEPVTDPETGIVRWVETRAPSVTAHVTASVTPSVTGGHLDRDGDREDSDKAYKLRKEGGTGGKPLTPEQADLANALETMLDVEWRNDAGKWIERIRSNPAKVRRVVAELKTALLEGTIRKSAAGKAEDDWKRFK